MKHRFGKSSIKMYDKCGIVLRIETTTNDVSFFKHHRKVCSVSMRLAHANETRAELREGPQPANWLPSRRAPTARSTCARSCSAATGAISPNLSALDDFSAGVRALDLPTKSNKVEERR